jgi:hypothetical protein
MEIARNIRKYDDNDDGGDGDDHHPHRHHHDNNNGIIKMSVGTEERQPVCQCSHMLLPKEVAKDRHE